MIKEENVDNLDKYLKVSKFKIEADKAKRNSHRFLYSQMNITSPERKIIKKTTIIEEPSILSKESDNNDDLKEMKESNYISSNVPVSRSSSLFEKKKYIKKNVNEGSDIKSKKDFKPGQFGSSRLEKIFKTKISNSNFDGGSELRSDYTHNSNYEFFINDNEKNKEFGSVIPIRKIVKCLFFVHSYNSKYTINFSSKFSNCHHSINICFRS